jgi:tRNA wybutosine-synthesizing protein 1
VEPSRLAEAQQVRHCALSLVGEPILYPEINEMVSELHSQNISTFMVTNAQFPDRIRQLVPVTQMYLSIDAATEASLQAIDRPVFEDFWARYLDSVDALAERKERTVFRLTLVRQYNMTDVENYAGLVRRGKPEFIEVKGVTYCGTSEASTLTMQNVPYHHEVLKFCEDLCSSLNRLGDRYDLACEHEHSCCVLIADKKFRVDGRWLTWIDFSAFFDLVRAGKPFTSMDYAAPTPSWALVGAPEKGFDPNEVRFRRKTKEEAIM